MRYLVVLLLVGCATTERVWERPGASQQDFFMDRGQCQAQSFGAPGLNTFQVALIFNSCMQGKGWYTVERPIQQASQAVPRGSADYDICLDDAQRSTGTTDRSSDVFKTAFWGCMEAKGHGNLRPSVK